MFRSSTTSLTRTLQRAKPSSSHAVDKPGTSDTAMIRRVMLTQRTFSTLHPRLSAPSSSPSPPPSQKASPQRPNPGNPEMPSFNLSSLGLSKNMKMLVLGLIGIFGTIETWFWCKAIWQWWEGRQQGSEAEAQTKG